MGLLLASLGGACFEESNPVDETGAVQTQSSGEECLLGTEGCPCIEGSCIEGLACLSNVCVDPGSTNDDGTTTDGPSTSTTATASSTPTTLDEGPLDEGPAMTTSMGGLPAGSPCDPFFDECEPGLGCVGSSEKGFFCDLPGAAGPLEPCDGPGVCGTGLVCVQADVLDACAGMTACCTFLCDVFAGGMCPRELVCEPFYPPMTAPPGYEHVGICASNAG